MQPSNNYKADQYTIATCILLTYMTKLALLPKEIETLTCNKSWPEPDTKQLLVGGATQPLTKHSS